MSPQASTNRTDKLVGTASLLFLMSVPVLASCHTPDDGRARPMSAAPLSAAPVPPPLLLRPISGSDAIAVNARIPFAGGPRDAAPPFAFAGDETARARAAECLAAAVYYEASGESREGEEAVAQVVLNRVRHPAFPATICGVVYQGSSLPTGCQFSFTCDGSLQRRPDRRGWEQALSVARAALAGFVYRPVGLSTHYHADYVVPYWATSLAKHAKQGAHIFYRWRGASGTAAAFSQTYGRRESDPSLLRAAALIAHGSWPSDPGGSGVGNLHLYAGAPPELVGLISALAPDAAERLVGLQAALHSALPDRSQSAPASALSSVRSGRQRPTTVDLELDADDPVDEGASLDQALEPSALRPSEAPRPLLADFVRKHPGDLQAAAKGAGQVTAKAASDWALYTGMEIEPTRLVLSLARRLASRDCTGADLPEGLQSVRAADARSFLSAGFSDQIPGRGDRRVRLTGTQRQLLDRYGDQIAIAVFARVTALSAGKQDESDLQVSKDSPNLLLVPLFEARLRTFERQRERYPTLAQFLPQLLRGLEASRPLASPRGDTAVAARCQAIAGSSAA